MGLVCYHFMEKTRATIYSHFHNLAVAQPGVRAVIGDDGSVTYAQLDQMAEAILAKIPPGEKTVGIVMKHSAEMIAAILAVLKSGAAYVPAEPSLPCDRIDYMMATAGVKLVIDDDFCRKLPKVKNISPDKSKPDEPAYILYTSGTTGRPKGVVELNRNVVNYAGAFAEEFAIGRGDVMLQYSVCSFDIFVEEVFATLLNGATLAIPPEKTRRGDMPGLMRFVRRHKVSIISGFPYLLAEMDALPSLPPSLRLLISGGDVLRASYIKNLVGRGIVIYNTYGPSETTVCATYQRCDNIEPLADGTYPIGHTVRGVSIKILDKDGQESDRGEICISGAGVSAGYLGNPPEQKNFVTLADGTRYYRSGDLGYMLPDGSLAFVRRNDDQVMILGKRVEPAEVENILNEAPGGERGVVCHFNDNDGLAYLVAYFVPRKQFSLRNIKKWLASKLSDFMVPEFFVAMKSIPLTIRGKVDRKALPVILKDAATTND